ncbi:acetylornithine deacetylase [Roseobacter ponti]|uniref:Acetylornithine deacetylase n=1 Tax=Roseobacter ponti TaxID=1891787 RepID=A0A858SVB6_9RHOB|nr:acetylornithine deacetylase [Roseobacter ponti]QJF50826.1 acetylornithine deacetylase [Roseobacter ponti]
MPDRLSPLELMTKLVSFPTVSSATNLPLVDWVEEYLSGHGIKSHRYADPDEPKAALFAHVGPLEEGAIVLSGHTDVVPVEGQDWSTDPYEVVEKDGRYYGRGTCDMKGFDALAIWALVEAQYAGVMRPLQLALSFDEEIGCVGAPPMIRAMQPVLPKGSAVIVGEPSEMQVVTGHKGSIGFEIHARGFEVHSSMPDKGVSAIMNAAKVIDWTNTVNDANRAAEPTDMAAAFDPSYTTAHVGVVRGGTAHNITAKDCFFLLDIRMVPGESAGIWGDRVRDRLREVETGMQAVVPQTGIDIIHEHTVPPLVPEEAGEAETLARMITGDNGTHVVSYGTEAGQFQEAGYSAAICGPGNIAQAHQPDEYISRAQFEAGHDFMKSLLRRLQT